ncbi:Bifunctional aspartokinase/homoserine dehydrogenase 2 [Vibrio aerogenes CECT 7868]|uniref:Bifunctional aspartokinase/homoserine dehydrogenase n=1 Tax=Vibrio aerogenes CECT 7868 TaxID=1216006 RepID=A0A1M5UEN4_9VIBR|nr:bifunctional aspartate kinase/homoserine dehydrogenase II [Vibrio aerogenes]SHH61429.1 Bifunctional aspartokinase/homoserine dehydrogenase 2 [Vibrio aerogenes CECT 7868]
MVTSRQLHKFGGSSLANPECYRRVATILKEYSEPHDLIVVSAAGKTTNHLIAFADSLSSPHDAHAILNDIRQFQLHLINDLLDGEVAQALAAQLSDEISYLDSLTAPLDDYQRNAILAHGESWSSRIMAALLNQHGMVAIAQDARTFLRAQSGAQPEVDRAKSYPLLQEILVQNAHQRIIFTGFIAQNDAGKTVLLGRNGSDYSATIIGALAEVERVTIWSDVAGVYSADPRVVEDACLLPLLRLDEASELARLAAPVLHSRTLQPVAQSSIDLHLRCSYQPESGSTHIERILASGRGAKIITSLDDVLLLEVHFTQGHDFNRQQAQVTELLKREQLAPLAVERQEDHSRIRLAYTAEMTSEVMRILQENIADAEFYIKGGYAMIAAVGAGITKNANHCFGFYQRLKQSSLEFIDSPESELSLVAILRKTPLQPLLTILHSQLFQAHKRVALALCGKGNIGASWLKLFAEQKEVLEKRREMNFELVAIISSQEYWLDEDGIDPLQAEARFSEQAKPYEADEWLPALGQLKNYDEVIVLDVTASKKMAEQYLDIAGLGMHLISVNKVAGAASSEYYYQIKDAFSKIGRHWFYNATVGAGLPINHTVRDLRESGDEITALSGIFSGTLSWLFQQYDGMIPFNELIDQAWQQGLTEPDPRHDLDGSDVMRKLVILARESGLEIEPDQVVVESLVPDELAELSLDDFLDKGTLLDEQLSQRLAKARKEDKVLRYVARLEKTGKATVGIEALPQEHPLANLLPCDNIFAIESKWYKDNPLVIRGPGAGREVTAGAIQSDINRLSGLL